MAQPFKRSLYFLLGLCGLISLICSIAASQVTNAALMKEGFLRFSQTGHLGVLPSAYGDYAWAITQYLDGKTDGLQIVQHDDGRTYAD
ncbi:MAG: hypothetical protein IJ189_08010, partial [Clostridia bacterium]|nr:hypothetical protein [Clostridia bacterium]